MPSTVIRRFVYDETECNLWVEFVSGRRYVYLGVPHDVAETFRGAFSKGVYFNTRIATASRFAKSFPKGKQRNLNLRAR
jgi:hypothetical protein